MLEVTLNEIDRSMQKREWRAKIDDIRHKMSRCKFEIENQKRNKFVAKRNAQRKKQAAIKLVQERKKMEKLKAQTLLEASGGRDANWKTNIEDYRKKVRETEPDLDNQNTRGLYPDAASKPKSKGDDEIPSDDEDYINYMNSIKDPNDPNYDPNDPNNVGGGNESDTPQPTNTRTRKGSGFSGGNKRRHYKTNSKVKNRGKNKGNKNGNGDEDDSKMSKHDKELANRIRGDLMDEAPDVSFQDVIGLENVKLALYESIILPNIRPDLFESVSKSVTGLLLFGPPGNGKTMIAKCVASECDASFFNISASSITSKFVGEAERIMRTLFDMARKRAPSIIFIDEIDSLLTARGGMLFLSFLLSFVFCLCLCISENCLLLVESRILNTK